MILGKVESMYGTDLPRGELFGRYRILGLIGQGGMARLHIAEQTGIEGFSKIVALKRVHPHLADSADLRRMFSTEAKLAAKLDHPNIAAVHELGEVDGTYFISMEYLPGEDLAAVLQHAGARSPMPLELALWIGEHAAAALHHAHELVDALGRPVGMVHRDVTPSNIMVTYHGVVKLLDFGIAKSRTSTVSTREGVFKGKLAYSAPEQLSGEVIDRRADVFCLGIVLWECLTGRRLFHAPTDAERIDAVRSREIVPPSSLRPEIPVELDAVVMRMLARDRNARYSSALQVQQTLGGMLSWQRDRVTPETAVAWLESIFGADRAAVKRSIAQGHNVESMVQALARMQAVDSVSDDSASTPLSTPQRPISKPGPRKAWSTGAAGGSSIRPSSSGSVSGVSNPGLPPRPPISLESMTSARPVPPSPAPSSPTQDMMLVDGDLTPPASAAPARTWAALAVGLALLVGVVIAGTIVMVESDGEPTAAPKVSTVGAIQVVSEPPGAQVFIDGNPTGQHTPVTLHRLPVDRAITVRVERPGLAPAEREVRLKGGEAEHLQFALVAAAGNVRLGRVPAGAKVYVDERSVDPSKTIELSVGKHAVRVESADDVLWSSTIDVRPGEQKIELGPR